MTGEISISDKIDRDFVFKLATRGYVKVLSHQVVIIGDNVDLTGIKLPPGVSIDWIGARGVAKDAAASVTFSFLDVAEGE